MIKLIKQLVVFMLKPETLTVEPPVVEESVKDISEPVLTLLKLLETPDLWEITEGYSKLDTERAYLTTTITGCNVSISFFFYHYGIGCKSEYIFNEQKWLTRDEKNTLASAIYKVKSLKLYKESTEARQAFAKELKC